MKIHVQNMLVDPRSVGVVELNFGQPRTFQGKALRYCTIEFPESQVIDEIRTAFREIKEDASENPRDWNDLWAQALCQHRSYEEFKSDDRIGHVVSLLEFIAHDLLMQLGLDQHLGTGKLRYAFGAFVQNPIRFNGSNIEIAGLCWDISQGQATDPLGHSPPADAVG